MVNYSRFIEIHEHGDTTKPKADLVVTTLHGETAKNGALIRENPDLTEKLDDRDREVLHTFLDLEADTYSEPLAWEFIQQLKEKRPDLKIKWVQVKAHRAYLDCNKARPEDATRKLWLNSEEHDPIRTYLKGVHTQILAELRAAIDGVPAVFDIHTMYPFSPISPKVSGCQAVMEQRGELNRYISAYLDGLTSGARRPLDVILTDGEGTSVSDRRLSAEFLRSTQSQGIHSRFDIPYNFGKRALVSRELIENRVGVAVDVPKDLLRNPKIKAPIFLEGEVDNDRVELVASTFVKAWLQRFTKRNGGWGQI